MHDLLIIATPEQRQSVREIRQASIAKVAFTPSMPIRRYFGRRVLTWLRLGGGVGPGGSGLSNQEFRRCKIAVFFHSLRKGCFSRVSTALRGQRVKTTSEGLGIASYYAPQGSGI